MDELLDEDREQAQARRAKRVDVETNKQEFPAKVETGFSQRRTRCEITHDEQEETKTNVLEQRRRATDRLRKRELYKMNTRHMKTRDDRVRNSVHTRTGTY